MEIWNVVLPALNQAWQNRSIGPATYGFLLKDILAKLIERNIDDLAGVFLALQSEGGFISELRNRTIYQIPLQLISPAHLSNIFDLVVGICWFMIDVAPLMAVGAMALDKLSSLIYDFKELEYAVKSVQDEFNGLLRTDRSTDKAYLEKVSSLCERIIDVRVLLNRAPNTLDKQNLVTTLNAIREAITGGLLRSIACDLNNISQEQRDGMQGEGCLPFMSLGEKGFNVACFQQIARALGLDGEDYPYLSLALAAKGIFSEKDFKFSNTESLEEMQGKVTLLLQDDTLQNRVQHQAKSWYQRVIMPIDRKIALPFAAVFQAVSFFVLFRNSQQYPGYLSLSCLLALDGAYFGYHGQRYFSSCRQFVGASLRQRVIWISRLQTPLTQLANAIVYAYRTRPAGENISVQGKYILDTLRGAYWGV